MDPWVRMTMLTVGGALGVNARYWLGVWMSRWVSPQFPWATLTINVSGSFAIGFLTILFARWQPHSPIRLLVLVGFLGGYTTFSTFSFETLTLWERGESTRALAYVVGSVFAALTGVALGAILARGLVLAVSEGFSRPPAEVHRSERGLPRFDGSNVESLTDRDSFPVEREVGFERSPEQAVDEGDTKQA